MDHVADCSLCESLEMIQVPKEGPGIHQEPSPYPQQIEHRPSCQHNHSSGGIGDG